MHGQSKSNRTANLDSNGSFCGNNVPLNYIKHMDEACRCLSTVGRNLEVLLQDLSNPPSCLVAQLIDVHRLEQEAKSLQTNVEALLHSFHHHISIAMGERKKELEDLQAKIQFLQKENERTHSQLAAAQGETARLRSQLQHQSTFCASLGAVLGNLVWKASRVPPVVDLLLSGNKVADFLCIVNGTLESFLETFDTVMPGPTADETQFIMAMGGIVTNMAAAPAGRQFLVSDPNGRELILQIIKILPEIPAPSGNCLKRLLLMALYNVSINQAGLNLLQEEGKGTIFSVASECLKPESTNELRTMALRLLLSLTCEIKDPKLIEKVPKEIIANLAKSEDSELQTMAHEVIGNVTKAQKLLGNMENNTEGCQRPKSAEITAEKRHSTQPTAAWRLPKCNVPMKGAAFQS